MKKTFLLIFMMIAVSATASAQKFALIDMEYIMNKIPAYQSATQQLEESTKTWQAEVEKVMQEVKSLYDKYQAESASLSESQRTSRENEIIEKEKQANELRKKYFGQEGELAKKTQSLMKPIQDAVYNAVKEIATQHGYSAVVDRASASSVIFASPDIDISDQVLRKLGY